MALLRFHQSHTKPGQAPRQNKHPRKPGRWNEPNFGMSSAVFMIGLGLIAFAGFAWAEFTHMALVSTLFMVVGAPFLIFGTMIALVIFVEHTWHRYWRVRHHCGRCRFYDAIEGQYTLGHCSVDPRDAVVHRLDSCSYYSYSERAMVRDRFTQRTELVVRVHKRDEHVTSETGDDLHGDGEQPPSNV